MAGAQVRGAPFHDAHHERSRTDDCADAIEHETVTQRNVGIDDIALHEWRQRADELGGLDGDQGVVESTSQLRRVGDRADRDCHPSGARLLECESW